ncbi:hypothetical protein DS901_09075 [Loktanella sp. D2R18]|uniref:DUF7678 domain-containing protein n=1 Tax=Rhodobacterales TaxID=204455 RepID=UPI000DEBDF43|nr:MULTISPECIES: hypothetical protein [Rhodobacterales]MDO6591492.1 hypothetical protein [Yoonia sp. 1_MG-2023]RBW43872.1 hypothetical protein DS901_09075 [Loktanella sp. D2R18]
MADDNSKDPFNKITNPDGTPLRDKDNAQPVLKPGYSPRPAPNLAPPGMSGIKQQKPPQKPKIQFRKPTPDQPQDRLQSGISIDGGKPDQGLWIKGRIVTMEGYSFEAKMYDQPSQLGIENGSISKLQVQKDGKQVMNFDRGWDQKPETAEHKEALQRIRNGLGDTPEKRPFKGFDQGRDTGHGMER